MFISLNKMIAMLLLLDFAAAANIRLIIIMHLFAVAAVAAAGAVVYNIHSSGFLRQKSGLDTLMVHFACALLLISHHYQKII